VLMKFTSGIYEKDGFTFDGFHRILLRADERVNLAFP
jgi:hypothetical protein